MYLYIVTPRYSFNFKRSFYLKTSLDRAKIKEHFAALQHISYHFKFIVLESYVLKSEKIGVTQALIYR